MAAAVKIPSQKYLKGCLSYDPETGILLWREREDMPSNWNSRWAGKPAFTASMPKGYKKGRLNHGNFLAHRIIWKLVYGFEPEVIDHVDGDRTNNRLANLRSVTQLENQRNQSLPITNTSGFVGVSRFGSKWRVRVQVRGKDKHLGIFANLEEAASARLAASIENGFHENHGRAV